MSDQREGPTTVTLRVCDGCQHLGTGFWGYTCDLFITQGHGGMIQPTLRVRGETVQTEITTPVWCPFLKAKDGGQ